MAGLLVALLLGSSVLVLLPGGAAASSPANPAGKLPAPAAVSYPTPIRHVITIMLENKGVDQVYGVVPYETSLAKSYAWGGDPFTNKPPTGYYAVCHPSAPNYLSSTAGTPLQCGSDSYHTYPDNNIGNLLTTAGLSWNAYMESATKNCQTVSSGNYAVRHNPFVDFTDISSVCASHDLAIANLTADFPFTTTPAAYTWITPNLLNDGHNTNAAYADTWLSRFVPKLMAQSWFSSTVVFIVWDESTGKLPDSGYNGLVGGPVYFAAVSPYTLHGGAYAGNSSHYNLLSTTEWLLGLGSTGHNDGTAQFPAMKSLFNFTGSPPPQNYSVTGRVTNASGSPLAGAEVFANGSASPVATTTDSAGNFSFSVPNGTYQVTATSSGYLPAATNVTVTGQVVSGISLALATRSSPPSTFAVNGTVTDRSSGALLAGATVYANSSSGSASTLTSAAGAFSLSLPNGTYRLAAFASGFAPSEENLTVAGAGAAGIGLSLTPIGPPPGTFPVVGSVMAYPNDTPLSDASLFANSSTAALEGGSAPNGSYTLDLPNGSYTITATSAGYRAQNISVTVGGTEVQVPGLSLIPDNFPVYPTDGVVLNNSGHGPVTNATLFFSNGSNTFRVLTNATGGYVATLPNGTYNVTVVASGFFTGEAKVSVAGATSSDLNFTLAPVAFHRPASSGGLPNALGFYFVTATAVVAAGLAAWTLRRHIRRTARRPPPP